MVAHNAAHLASAIRIRTLESRVRALLSSAGVPVLRLDSAVGVDANSKREAL